MEINPRPFEVGLRNKQQFRLFRRYEQNDFPVEKRRCFLLLKLINVEASYGIHNRPDWCEQLLKWSHLKSTSNYYVNLIKSRKIK